MNKSSLQQLIEKAKTDPSFFHSLVFEPEKIRDQLKTIDESSHDKIIRNKPESVINRIIQHLSGDCSCTTGTCGGTCGGSTCSVTCSGDSCGRTCDDSCGTTSGFSDRFQSYRSFGR